MVPAVAPFSFFSLLPLCTPFMQLIFFPFQFLCRGKDILSGNRASRGGNQRTLVLPTSLCRTFSRQKLNKRTSTADSGEFSNGFDTFAAVGPGGLFHCLVVCTSHVHRSDLPHKSEFKIELKRTPCSSQWEPSSRGPTLSNTAQPAWWGRRSQGAWDGGFATTASEKTEKNLRFVGAALSLSRKKKNVLFDVEKRSIPPDDCLRVARRFRRLDAALGLTGLTSSCLQLVIEKTLPSSVLKSPADVVKRVLVG